MKNDEEYRRRRQRLLRQQRIDNDDDVDRSFGLNGVKCSCVFFVFCSCSCCEYYFFFLVVVIPFQVHNTNNNNKNLFNLKQEKGGILGCFCFGIKTIWSFFWVCFLLKTKAPFFVFFAFFQKNVLMLKILNSQLFCCCFLLLRWKWCDCCYFGKKLKVFVAVVC